MLDEPLLAAEAEYNLAILYDRYRPDPARALAHYEAALRRRPDRTNAGEVRARIEALRKDLERSTP
jgi:hypothetical protein